MDREAWRAAIHGVAKSRTGLSDWSLISDNLQRGSCKIFSFGKKLAVGVQGVSPPSCLDLLRPALGHRGQVSAMYQPAPSSPAQSPQPPVPALPPQPWLRLLSQFPRQVDKKFSLLSYFNETLLHKSSSDQARSLVPRLNHLLWR